MSAQSQKKFLPQREVDSRRSENSSSLELVFKKCEVNQVKIQTCQNFSNKFFIVHTT